MRRDRIRRAAFRCTATCLVLCCFEPPADPTILAAAPSQASPRLVKLESPGVVPVHGPSWLRQVETSVSESCMGQTGNWSSGPLEGERPVANDFPKPVREGDSFFVTGADLYRLNCAACHKPDGRGVPPAIPSLIGPVRGTSAVLFRAQMKARGFEVDEATVRELTTQSTAALRSRLLNGGDKMPAFPHLDGVEMVALIAHLRLLAGVPGAEGHQVKIKLPALQVGEHLVKGTCHICHDATGPGREGSLVTSMLHGVIPSLASFSRDRTRAEVIRKVREGLAEPALMMTRGRMPILEYLTAEEVGAAYDYLSVFPPVDEPTAEGREGREVVRPLTRGTGSN